MQSLANVWTDEMNALQALLALTGEQYVDLVSFTDEADPLDMLEEIPQ